ncbi:hypothetical protein I41_37640 [Lacipirellula limnantheis]|uniref:Uncharacterized protein n=1 Tax=Lacipirellula limnantheis TaxID=2528024 RepID=A0A517U1S1_9BACT|nr:hypothetical protein I41_37640 [Lacipirellula limnantheis]
MLLNVSVLVAMAAIVAPWGGRGLVMLAGALLGGGIAVAFARSALRVGQATSYCATIGGATTGLLVAWSQFEWTHWEQGAAVMTGILLGTLIFCLSYTSLNGNDKPKQRSDDSHVD